MRDSKTTDTLLFSILFLFHLQVLSDFIEAIYAYGLLVTAFTVEVASILLLFTPLLLFLFRKRPSRPILIALAYVGILARLLEPMLDPGGKLVASGISVGAFMMLFPFLVYSRISLRGWQVGSGLLIALATSIFLRTAGSSLDLSEFGMFQVISWAMGVLAAALFWRMDLSVPAEDSARRPAAGGRISGLAIGLASVILMIYYAFASPTVIARWTEASYPSILAALVSVLILFCTAISSERFSALLDRRLVLAWNALFTLLLVLTILSHQVAFPTDPALYPVDAPAAPSSAGLFLYLMLLLSPILFVDFMLFARQLSLEKPSLRQLGGAFALSSLFFLLMVFFHVFTTIYDYAPVVGPLFRDRFWCVHLLAGLGMGLPVLLLGKEAYQIGKPEIARRFVPAGVGALAILTVFAIYITSPRPVVPQDGAQVKIMTYNIQQGFDKAGNANLDGQLAVIRSVDPDILGLQESGTARIANGNADAVRFFADSLDMYSYYGPTTTTGTFGIALLSRYPIEQAGTFFMYSKGEQTATIHAQITIDGRPYQIFVTHLGNGGPIVQLQNMLARLQGRENVIAMGDFNFDPTTEQYTLMTGTLADSWLLRWPGGKEIPGVPADDRIDHIFVSPGMRVLESEYVAGPASDHPYMYTVIEP